MLIEDVTLGDIPEGYLRSIYSYWESKKEGRLMPSRSDIKPEEFYQFLPQVVLIDVERDPAPVRFRARLVGTKVVDAIGQDFTGLYFDSFPNIERMVARFKVLVEKKDPYLVNDNVQWPEKAFMEYFGLALPLSDNGKDVNIIMLGMYYPLQHGVVLEHMVSTG